MKYRLGDLIDQIRGVSYKPTDLHNILDEDSVVLLRANNIYEGKINFDEVVYVDKTKVKEEQYLKKGDIFICASSGSKHLVGKAAYIDEDLKAVFGAFCKVVRLKNKKYAQYIGHYFNSPTYRNIMNNISLGSNINNIRNEDIEDLIVNWYSDDQQHKIVSILDQVNHLISLRTQQLEQLDLIVKSRFVEMFGDDKKAPKVTMADITSIITDGTHQPPKFQTSGIPFIFVSNITTNELDYKTEKFISQETYDELYKRTPIEIGDLLLSTVGSYGHSAIVKKNDKFLFQRHIAYLKPIREKINSVYLQGVILTDDVQRQIDKAVKGIAQKTLNLSEVKKLTIPLPPLALQNQFAEFVQQVDKSKLAIKKSLEQLETLKKKLMQDYFG